MNNNTRKKIFLFITDAGGGHRASAVALKASAELAGLPWDVRIVNVYREVWAGVEPMKQLTGFYAEDAYNFVLKNNLQIWTGLMRVMARFSASLPNTAAKASLAKFLSDEKPDLCVSLMPFINDVLLEAATRAGCKLGLICTDLMDTKPYMWYTPGICKSGAFISAPTPQAEAQALEMGAGERLVRSGLLIHPKYFDKKNTELPREEALKRFELDPGVFTVAIIMGGYGGKVILDFVRSLDASKRDWQVVACCGNNEALRLKLEALKPGLKNRLLALGFTDQVPALLLRAADVVVTKPGPATLMEALAIGAPLVLDDVNTMPQERPNAAWIEGLGPGDRRQRPQQDLGGRVLDPGPGIQGPGHAGCPEAPRAQGCLGSLAGGHAAMPIKFHTILISDVHFGSPMCQAEELQEFLKNLRVKTLILNGDIFEDLKVLPPPALALGGLSARSARSPTIARWSGSGATTTRWTPSS